MQVFFFNNEKNALPTFSLSDIYHKKHGLCRAFRFFSYLCKAFSQNKRTMKRTLIIVVVLFLSAVAANAQQDTVGRHFLLDAMTAINSGDCPSAQVSYGKWQRLSDQNNDEIEQMIRDCFRQNPEKDPPYEPVPGTTLLITKRPVAKRVTFVQAMKTCAELRYGGWDDWRLPTTNELFAIFAAGLNHGRVFAGMSFGTGNRIIRGNTTVNEYDVMRPDGTTSHRSTCSNDNLPFDCFCVREVGSD